MSVGSPEMLVLLALAPLAATAYALLARWRRQAGERFAPAGDARRLTPSVSTARRALKATLVVLALAALAVSLARPRVGEDEQVVPRASADVVIALDVSRSMLAADAAPSRLAVAQRSTLALLERLRGDRVGLVIFAREPLARSPLTTDTEAVGALVRSAQQDAALLAPGSDLGAALRAAGELLETSAATPAGPATGGAVVLVSDGEDHGGAAVAAARELASRGVRLYTTVVGTATGAPVPDVDPRTGAVEAPALGDGVAPTTQADELLLRRVAASSLGGRYVPVEELPDLAGDIDTLRRTSAGGETQRRPLEWFQWPVLVAFILLVVEALTPERKGAPRRAKPSPLAAKPATGGVVAFALLAMLVGTACASAADGRIAEGNRAYERGRYGEALESYRQASALEPDDAAARINAGLALHRVERYDEAIAETARALPVDEPALAARAHYQLGTHYFVLLRLPEAIAEFRETLLIDPRHRDAKHNLELANELLDDLRASGEDPGSGQAGPQRPPPGEAGAPEGVAEPGGAAAAAQAAEVSRALAEALEAGGDELTVAEALRALDLVAQLSRLQPVAPPRGPGAGDGPDY